MARKKGGPMARKTADMFSQFEHIRERMDQAYRRVLGGSGGPGGPGFGVAFLEPAADIYETDDEVVVVVELAGISGAEIDVEIEGRVLHLQGERRPLPGRPQMTYSQIEIAHGSFQRELLLPAEVNADEAKASYRDGILEVVLPKASSALNRQLRIVAR
jgi:HSP20 family protein